MRFRTAAVVFLAVSACSQARPADRDRSSGDDTDAAETDAVDTEPADSEPLHTDETDVVPHTDETDETDETDAPCEVGVVASAGTDQDLDLFGDIVWFDGGAELPAGRYRITYVDGCMKYSSGQLWAVHAYADGSAGWWLVGETTDDRVRMPPGTVGFDAASGGFETFEACVTANAYLAPQEFDFGGGKLGLWLHDSPYTDNVAGVDGRNPSWRLDRLGGCE